MRADAAMGVKRFYGEAAVERGDGAYAVVLDGRCVRTPAGKPLAVPREALARAIAAEWAAQGQEIRPETMPLTRLANTAIDRVAPQRAAVIEQILRYAATDLLCYRAEAPAGLVERQQRRWQPLLDWAAEALGARLRVTKGVLPVDQPPEAVGALARAVDALDDMALTALAEACAGSGSLVIALALARGRIDAEQAHALARLDEDYQNERWGEDAETRALAERARADLAAAAAFLSLGKA